MKSWKRFTLEFISIFIAVVSAFALNNWNENRRDKNAEEKILSEIYIGINKDLEDLHINKSGHKAGIEAVKYFKNIISNDIGTSDSIMYYFFNLTRDYISIQNTSGYEALKSKGLELIENDILRSDIISLYEYDYAILRKFEEEYYESQFQENYYEAINEIIADDFIIDDDKNIIGINTPLSLNEQEEIMLISYLWKIEINRKYIYQSYSDVIVKTEKIRDEINIEIDK